MNRILLRPKITCRYFSPFLNCPFISLRSLHILNRNHAKKIPARAETKDNFAEETQGVVSIGRVAEEDFGTCFLAADDFDQVGQS